MWQSEVNSKRVAGVLGMLACAAAWTGSALAQPLPQPQAPRPVPPSARILPPTPTGTVGAGPVSLLACLILPARTADIGSPVVGVVASVEVERGDLVRKGQVLARLRADVEQANSGVARRRAENEAEWRGAVASQDLARIKMDRARSLKDQNFVSGQAVEQAESEYRIAKERAAQVREQLDVSSYEASSALAQLSQRTLRAPFDGVVTERFANPGERFEDKPLLKIADISQLRVDVVASTALFGSLRIGQDVTVRPELPATPPRLAQISQIDRVLDPASNTFRLRLAMDNPNRDLPAGLRCKAELGRGDGAAAAGASEPGAAAANSVPTTNTDVTRTRLPLPAGAARNEPRKALGNGGRGASPLPAPAARPPSAPLPSMERLLMDLSPLTGVEMPATAKRPAPAAVGGRAPQTLAPERR